MTSAAKAALVIRFGWAGMSEKAVARLHIAAACFTLLWLANFAVGFGATGLLITLPLAVALVAHIMVSSTASPGRLHPGGWLFYGAVAFALLGIAGSFFLAPALRRYACSESSLLLNVPFTLECGRRLLMLAGPFAAAGLWLLSVCASVALMRAGTSRRRD